MGMGIVSDSDFDSERGKLNRTNTTSKAEIKESPTKGRGLGNVEVPDSLRKVIGETSVIDGREAATELAKNFGISPSSVSAYSVGANSTTSYADRPNQSHVDDVKNRISKKARGKLMLALTHLTKDKLEAANARTLAGVAKDMSAVVKNMEPDTPKVSNETNGPTFVIYAPQYRKEEHFEVVQAKE
jgi:hypothetical protein